MEDLNDCVRRGSFSHCQPAALLVVTTGLLPDPLPQLKCNCKEGLYKFCIFYLYSLLCMLLKSLLKTIITLAQLNESRCKKPAIIT